MHKIDNQAECESDWVIFPNYQPTVEQDTLTIHEEHLSRDIDEQSTNDYFEDF